MKILMISSEYPPDRQNGAAVTFAELYEQTRQQCNTRLIAGWNRARSLIPPEAIAVDISDLSSPQRNLRILQTLQQEAQRWKPDILLINDFLPYVGRVPCITLLHGSSLYDRSGRLDKIKTAIQGRFLSRHGRIICNSQEQKQQLLQLGIPSQKLQILRHGINLNSYQYVPQKKTSPIQIVCPVRIFPAKRIERIIDAIAKLRTKEKQQIELHIVGTVLNHVYADKLRIQAYGQPVSFHPDVKDMRPYIHNSHLIIYPHQSNSYIHRTAMESMALGRCVLWYGEQACKDPLTSSGINCAGDSESLRNQIRWILANLEKVLEKGRRGREHIIQKYSWSTIWKVYPEIFHDLLGS